MIAYTAWDSLQAIAHQYDADLRLDSEAHIALTPRRDRFVGLSFARRLARWVDRGIVSLQLAPGSCT